MSFQLHCYNGPESDFFLSNLDTHTQLGMYDKDLDTRVQLMQDIVKTIGALKQAKTTSPLSPDMKWKVLPPLLMLMLA